MEENPQRLSIPDETEIRSKEFTSAEEALRFLAECGFPREEFAVEYIHDFPVLSLNPKTERGQQYRRFSFLHHKEGNKFCFSETGIRFLKIEKIINDR